ncbi:MAG: DoxX family protein [Vicinamibacterales bacterium]
MDAVPVVPTHQPSLFQRAFSRRTLIAVLQVVLAIVFLAHGIMFLNPPAEVAQLMNAMLPRWFQVFLGVAEVLAAAGLTLPAVTGIMPQLVFWAAAGTMVVLGSACVLHTVRGEWSSAITTAVLFAMAAVVARARRHA